MALPASDSFTTGTNQALTDYSANWTNAYGSFYVLAASDDVHCNNPGNEGGAFWNADSFNDAQYAQLTVSAISDAGFIGPAVRCSVNNYYGAYQAASSEYYFEVVGGSWNQLGTDNNGASATDVLYLEIDASDNLTYKVNGGTVFGPTNDDSLASGAAGITGWTNSSETRGDSWIGDNLGAAAQNLTPSGIVTAESLGTAQLDMNITVSGVVTAEALGSATIAFATEFPFSDDFTGANYAVWNTLKWTTTVT